MGREGAGESLIVNTAAVVVEGEGAVIQDVEVERNYDVFECSIAYDYGIDHATRLPVANISSLPTSPNTA